MVYIFQLSPEKVAVSHSMPSWCFAIGNRKATVIFWWLCSQLRQHLSHSAVSLTCGWTLHCLITAASCYTLCCVKKQWYACTSPSSCTPPWDGDPLVDIKILPWLSVDLQASQMIVLLCAWFPLFLQPGEMNPIAVHPGWIPECSELRYIPGQCQESEPPRFICLFQTHRNPDCFIDCCILGHNLICALHIALIFSSWASISMKKNPK